MEIAFLCRYGNQNVYELLGRDPKLQPLTSREQTILASCIQEHVTVERQPLLEIAAMSPMRR